METGKESISGRILDQETRASFTYICIYMLDKQL